MDDNLKALARLGAATRLREIENERRAILKLFPELKAGVTEPAADTVPAKAKSGKKPRAKRVMSEEAKEKLRRNLTKARKALAKKRATEKA